MGAAARSFALVGLAAGRLVARTEEDLRRGLERGEVVPFFQPVVDMASGRLRGFEARARWLHPDSGPVAADQWLPLAEQREHLLRLGFSLGQGWLFAPATAAADLDELDPLVWAGEAPRTPTALGTLS